MALLLREDDVRAAIDMEAVIEAVAAATAELGRGLAQNQPRRRVRHPAGLLNTMSATVPSLDLCGFKTYTVAQGTARFLVGLFGLDGRPRALIEADLMGAYRTGAATAVAARRLKPGARRVALIGTGRQARTQALALSKVLEVERIFVYGRDRARREAFASRAAAELGLPALAASAAREAVEGADLVVTMTNSPEPVLESGWVGPETLVVAAGSNIPSRAELPPDLVARCRPVVVDQLETARLESGDLVRAAEAGLFDWALAVELGALLAEDRQPPAEPGDTALFESHGLAVWDVAAGAAVLARAREMGLGEEIRLFD